MREQRAVHHIKAALVCRLSRASALKTVISAFLAFALRRAIVDGLRVEITGMNVECQPPLLGHQSEVDGCITPPQASSRTRRGVVVCLIARASMGRNRPAEQRLIVLCALNPLKLLHALLDRGPVGPSLPVDDRGCRELCPRSSNQPFCFNKLGKTST